MTHDSYQEHVDEDGASTETRVQQRRFDLSPARIVGGIAGALLGVIGIIAIARAGLDSTLNEPVVTVAGLDMSAVVGIGFLVVGLILLLAAATYGGGSAVGACGVILILFGIFAVAITNDLRSDIGVGTDTGWFAIVVGVACLAAMFIHPRMYQRRDVRRRDQVAPDRY
jgi:hypothetical protein